MTTVRKRWSSDNLALWSSRLQTAQLLLVVAGLVLIAIAAREGDYVLEHPTSPVALGLLGLAVAGLCVSAAVFMVARLMSGLVAELRLDLKDKRDA